MILDLTNINNSRIKYKIHYFPDGQQDITIEGEEVLGVVDGEVQKIISLERTNRDFCTIISRLNNWRDLELIICANKALKGIGVYEISLYIPYLLGARSDRQFVEGGNSYLRDILAPVLNAQGFKFIKVIDVHSNVANAVIPNLVVGDNEALVKFALKDIYGDKPHNYNLVAPDAGAQHKIFNLAKEIGFTGEIITCSKERDLITGKIIQTHILGFNITKHNNKDLIIVDDIADGAGTFIEIAKRIKEYKYNNNIYLIVTHSIFSKGTDELLKYFDGIYTTNSYKEHNVEKVKVLNIF